MKKLITLTILLLASIALSAQTFNGEGGPIPSDKPAYYSINVESLEPAKLDTSFGVIQVGINLTHVATIEVEVALIAPDGTQVILTAGNGYDGDNYTNTFFENKAEVNISAGTAPFNGTFRPNEMLGSVNNGQAANGEWKLQVIDTYAMYHNPGTLLNWSITFGNHATGPDTSFTSSNLPIVIINTDNKFIPNDPKVEAELKIINNTTGNRNKLTDSPQFEGNSGIGRRGIIVGMDPKKSYALETWDASGNAIDTSLLGMPAENEWILIAGFADKTLIRNALAFEVWQNMGHYATRYQLVELIINGLYKGVYTFSEKIKQDKNRIDISNLEPDENAGDSLTGGYIIKIDKINTSGDIGWTSPFPPSSQLYAQTTFFQYEYPNARDITAEQKTYIKEYITDFETALNGPNFADTVSGFRKYADESTFIDYFLLNEVNKSIDAFRSSVFLYKDHDSKGGKLRMGPTWENDFAWHNVNFCGGDLYTGWAYKFPCTDDDTQVPFWWSRLLEDTLFTANLKCRWETLKKDLLNNSWFDHYIDSMALQLDEAQQRNHAAWDVLDVALWINPKPVPSTYQGEINSLKDWIHNRLTWLDKNMPGKCSSTGIDFAENGTPINVYPNPATSKISIEMPGNLKGETTICIFNTDGTKLRQHQFKTPNQVVIDVSTLAKGIYLLQIQSNKNVVNKKLVIQ